MSLKPQPTRPFFLDLTQIRLPIGAWVSIFHRASGALLSLLIPVLLYALMLSLRSPQDYERLVLGLSGPLGWSVLTLTTWALLHHFLAGLRHLGFDLGWGEEKARARQTAWVSLVLAVAMTLLLAMWRLPL